MYLFKVVVERPVIKAATRERLVDFGCIIEIVDVYVGVVDDYGLVEGRQFRAVGLGHLFVHAQPFQLLELGRHYMLNKIIIKVIRKKGLIWIKLAAISFL